MMNDEQRELLISTLGLTEPLTREGEEAMQRLHLQIKRAYVRHSPTEFRVTVSHYDLPRLESPLRLQVGNRISLVALTTERYVPVEIVELPRSARSYYRGVITDQPAKLSKFEVGDSVFFSEDQVLVPKSPARRGAKREG